MKVVKKEQIIWLCLVKDLLWLAWMMALLMTAPGIFLITQGHVAEGLGLIFIAAMMGILSFSLANYWHKRDIHTTAPGFFAGLLFFITVSILLWQYGLPFWIPIILLIIYTVWASLTRKN